MHVEKCCQAVLADVLPGLDPKRAGWCIDAGVGDFAFYCRTFARLGYPSAAVEPLPVDKLRAICLENRVRLFECVLADHDGSVTLYMGMTDDQPDTNLNTLRSDWWGAGPDTLRVQSMTLPTLLSALGAHAVTCLKLDLEGAEPDIIHQLPDLPTHLLPRIVQFEYGGGAKRGSRQAGWTLQAVAEKLECLQLLRQCGYTTALVIDGAAGTHPHWLDIQTVAFDADIVFDTDACYGNIMCFRESPSAAPIDALCARYLDNSAESPLVLPAESIIRRTVRRVLSHRG
jgi:FkbM family methyltransferase